MNKEFENERRGKVMISSSEFVSRGLFNLCVKEESVLINLCSGSFTEIGEAFFANGVARKLIAYGQDVFFVFNPEDLKDEEVRKYIVPKSMKLDGLIG